MWQVIFYVERSVIFRVCESALYGLLKKCFPTKKVLDIVAFLVKYIYIWNVHQTGQGIINKSV